jgi:S1-C subfamily serine protease
LITANFVHRTFRIKCGQSAGTGFALDVDGRQYLVTAKHVVEGFSPPAVPLDVFGNQVWTQVSAHLVAHGPTGIDVSVLAPDPPLSPPGLPVVASSDGCAYGQDVYFLGFPYGALSGVVFGQSGHPLPLVKKAILSSFAGNLYLLDGHNNPGFSGGPVVFGRGGSLPNAVAAVISGYRFSPEPVLLNDTDTGLTYRYNTGIIYSYKIETALELIRSNPIGPVAP